MPSDYVAIGLADAFEVGEIFGFVGEIPSHRRDVFRSSSRFAEHCNDVLQRLAHLADKIVGLELLLPVPADLAADKDLPPARGNAVGVAYRFRPALGLQDGVHRNPPKFFFRP